MEIYPITRVTAGLFVANANCVAHAAQNDMRKVILMVSEGNKISRVVGWLKRTPLDAPINVTEADYLNDKGLSIERNEDQYRRVYDVDGIVTVEGKRSMNCVMGITTLAYTLCNFAEPPTMVFYTASCYEYFYQRVLPFVAEGMVTFRDEQNPNFNMAAVLIPLFILPNFKDDLARYVEDMDRAGQTELQSFPLGPEPLNLEGPDVARYADRETVCTQLLARLGGGDMLVPNIVMRKDVVYGLAYTIMYLMLKTGTPANILVALKKRLESMKNAMKLEDFDVDNFCNRRVTAANYSVAYNKMNFYPKLKAVIFSCLLSHDDEFTIHVKEILKESQFTVFNFIVTFVTARPLTALHVIQEVMGEYEGFMNSFDALRTRYGQCWPYCKLVNPTESLGTLSQYPNLANAAKAYALVTSGAESLKNIQGMRKVPAFYFQYAKTNVNVGVAGAWGNLQMVKAKLAVIRVPNDTINALTEDILAATQTLARGAALPAGLGEFLDGRARD